MFKKKVFPSVSVGFQYTSRNPRAVLVPKASTIADYTFRPERLHNICLWDFLSLSDKYRRNSSNDSNSFDNGNDLHRTMDDEDCSNSSLNFERTSHSDHSFLGSVSSMVDSVYLQRGRLSAFRFRPQHPEYATHALRILPYRENFHACDGANRYAGKREIEMWASCQMVVWDLDS
jgi:hypothetical protein